MSLINISFVDHMTFQALPALAVLRVYIDVMTVNVLLLMPGVTV